MKGVRRRAAVPCWVIAGLLSAIGGCQPAGTGRRDVGDVPAEVASGAPGPHAGPKILGDRQGNSAGEPAMLSPQAESSPFRFAEVAGESGIDFLHFSGTTPDKYFPTANGSGVAMFDYDNDGRLDLYFATATLLPLGT